MRIDKFLKVSRLIKRRALAKDVTDSERILVNNRVVKPSYQVKVGDLISIIFGTKTIGSQLYAERYLATPCNLFDAISLL